MIFNLLLFFSFFHLFFLYLGNFVIKINLSIKAYSLLNIYYEGFVYIINEINK